MTAFENAVGRSPSSTASRYSSSAFLLSLRLLSISLIFKEGGFPSKTKTRLIPYSEISLVVLKASPTRWLVTFPSLSLRGVPVLSLINARNSCTCITMYPSTAKLLPRRSSSSSSFLSMIGVRRTPNVIIQDNGAGVNEYYQGIQTHCSQYYT